MSCPYGQSLDSSGVRRLRMFESTDGGSTWSKARPINGGFVNENGPLVGSFVQSSSLVAWSWTEYIGSGAGAVERTVDGGRHWRTIFPSGVMHVVPPITPVLFMLPVDFAARSSSSAYLVVEVYERSGSTHFLLGATKNRGSTWRWSYLVNERSGTDERPSGMTLIDAGRHQSADPAAPGRTEAEALIEEARRRQRRRRWVTGSLALLVATGGAIAAAASGGGRPTSRAPRSKTVPPSVPVTSVPPPVRVFPVLAPSGSSLWQVRGPLRVLRPG